MGGRQKRVLIGTLGQSKMVDVGVRVGEGHCLPTPSRRCLLLCGWEKGSFR
jgi:hypothetical protein